MSRSSKPRFPGTDWTIDYNRVTWPIAKYLDEKKVVAADLIRQFDMLGKDALYRWMRAGESPVEFYKAAIANFGPSKVFNESTLPIRQSKRHPTRIPGQLVHRLALRFDEIYPNSRFHSSRLPKAAASSIVPTFPKSTSGTSTSVSSTPKFDVKDHAGLVAMIKLTSVLKTERDGLMVTNIDLMNQIGERDLRIQTLESELDAAKAMLDEALSNQVPATPALTPEERELKEMGELEGVITQIGDVGLLVELDRLRPKSPGLGS